MSISHIFDTYAKTAQGRIIHFDVVVDDKDAAKAIGVSDAVVTQENCVFCHSAEAPPILRKQIESQGYGIYKLEGCPK